MHAIDALICAAVRGEAPPWPYGGTADTLIAFHERAEYHGVGGLLHVQPRAADWPAEASRTLRELALNQAIWELGHQQAMNRALASMAAIGVRAVLFKGTALAYSLYANPVLRARGDTDVIVPEGAQRRVHDALAAAGFQRDEAAGGEFASYQANYAVQAPGNGWHSLDLHWKINNSVLLSRLFTHEELLAQAVPLPALGPDALAASAVHALLLACMHRATHKQNPYYVEGTAYYGGDRLIWLYDIHLLARALSAEQWTEFAGLAHKKGLRAVCLEGMHSAARCLHTAYPQAVMELLRENGTPEPAARYLNASKPRQQWLDFRALHRWTDRRQLIREVFFPPATYMREKYVNARAKWLPWLYLRRAAWGLARGLRASRFLP